MCLLIFLIFNYFFFSPGDIDKSEVGWAAVPGQEDEFRRSVDFTIPYATALDCKM